MRTFAALAVGGALSLAVGALPGHAASTSPGKSSAFESSGFMFVPASPATLLTATIAKGKKKKVLAIEATLSTDTGASGVLEIRPLVNDVAVEGGVVSVACQPGLVHCSVSGSWWLDVDAAEAANPGVFVKQPLVVRLVGGYLAGGDPDIAATGTLSVRVESK
jgi:hypothetical protein